MSQNLVGDNRKFIRTVKMTKTDKILDLIDPIDEAEPLNNQSKQD